MQNGNGEYSTKFALLNSVARVVTGQWVAHAQLTLAERAYEAADLHTGKSCLVLPTIGQAADLWRVNRTYVGWALKRPKDRALVTSGVVPLALPPAVKALPVPHPVTKLAEVVAALGMTGTLDALTAIEKAAA